METLGSILGIAGSVISLIAAIWFIFVAFSESIWWGLGSLIVPFVSLIFLIRHWEEAAKPFGWSLMGMLVSLAGVLVTRHEQVMLIFS